MSGLPPEALERYARHIVLRELGGAGQARLGAARVAVVGAGGLGCPALIYLAAAGIGRITVIDDDSVSLSNLQRQILFATADIGRPKAVAAAERLAALNPLVTVRPVAVRLDAANAAGLLADHDLVLDGTDSFAARQAVNAAAVAAGLPLIAAALGQWEAQIGLYHPAAGAPCLACVFPRAPAPGVAPDCATAGIVGALPGVMGAMMALEAIKHIARTGRGLAGRLLLYDALTAETRIIAIRRDPACAICGGVGEGA